MHIRMNLIDSWIEMERKIKGNGFGSIKFFLDMHKKPIFHNTDKNNNNVIHLINIQWKQEGGETETIPQKWKVGAVMSIAQFDEIYEICCEEEEEVTLLVKVRLPIKHSKLLKDCIPDSNRWWEEVAKEVQKEKESELFYV